MMETIKDVMCRSRFTGKFVECPVKKTLCLADECFNCAHIDNVSSLYNHYIKCIVKEVNAHKQTISMTTYSLPLLEQDKI